MANWSAANAQNLGASQDWTGLKEFNAVECTFTTSNYSNKISSSFNQIWDAPRFCAFAADPFGIVPSIIDP